MLLLNLPEDMVKIIFCSVLKKMRKMGRFITERVLMVITTILRMWKH